MSEEYVTNSDMPDASVQKPKPKRKPQKKAVKRVEPSAADLIVQATVREGECDIEGILSLAEEYGIVYIAGREERGIKAVMLSAEEYGIR